MPTLADDHCFLEIEVYGRAELIIAAPCMVLCGSRQTDDVQNPIFEASCFDALRNLHSRIPALRLTRPALGLNRRTDCRGDPHGASTCLSDFYVR